MNVYTYKTSGGKDLIRNYLDSLPQDESAEGYHIIENIYLLHACKKQKGKAEKFELNTARKRAKEII